MKWHNEVLLSFIYNCLAFALNFCLVDGVGARDEITTPSSVVSQISLNISTIE